MGKYSAEKRNMLGIGLQPGDRHYRAFVGPPEKYDLVAATQFNLLTFLGLREYHYLLDIGCGSLRAGRLFIPYLLTGHYFGIEPEQWLVEEGMRNEIGEDIVKIKKPQFLFCSDFNVKKFDVMFDFAIAQSIFSHASPLQIKLCLKEVSTCLKQHGILVATFVKGEEDYTGSQWVYPDCVEYTVQGIRQLAKEENLGFRVIDWPHPNGQSWALFGDPSYIYSIEDPTYSLCKRIENDLKECKQQIEKIKGNWFLSMLLKFINF